MEKKLLNGTIIKWIVIVAMIIDHSAWAFVPTESVAGMLCHTIGRMAAPTMFYFLVEGYHKTSNFNRYLGRMAIFAAISHFPYSLYVNYGKILPFQSSVGTTLLCGLLILWAMDKIKNPVLKALILTLLIGVTYWCDWAIWGPIFIIGFGAFYGDNKKQWISFFVINVAKVFYTYFFLCGFNLYKLIPVIVGPMLVYAMFRLYDGTRGTSRFARISKWAFYIIYPLQFGIIGLIWLWVYVI